MVRVGMAAVASILDSNKKRISLLSPIVSSVAHIERQSDHVLGT